MPDFEVRRDDLRTTRTTAGEERASQLPPGHVQLAVDRFALTANTITYGAAGDLLGYWRFFPAEDGWGRVPAWGFGEVVASGVDGIDPGARFYGYFPMSSYVTMQAAPGGPGFQEVSPHRAELPPLYNRYIGTALDPAYDADHEDELAIMRPLFFTSFLLEDHLSAADFFGAEAVVLTSASSKTAFGLAFLLARAEGAPDVIGLTSEGNREFVESLRLYDRVLSYDEIGQLSPDVRHALIDMAGNRGVVEAIHRHLRDSLRQSTSVGLTHWEEASFAPPVDLPGPPPEFFFAPTQIDRLTEELGPGVFQQRLAEAWKDFVDPLSGWMEIERGEGPDAVERVFSAFVDGTVDPRRGYVLSLSPG